MVTSYTILVTLMSPQKDLPEASITSRCRAAGQWLGPVQLWALTAKTIHLEMNNFDQVVRLQT